MIKRPISFVVLCIAAGCAADNAMFDSFQDAPTDTTSPVTDGTTETEVDSGSSDTAPEVPDAAYYSLALEFTLGDGTVDAAGLWQLETARLSIGLWSAERALLCTHEVPVLAVTAAPPPEISAPLVGWWRIETDAGVPDTLCPAWPAQAWQIGIGAYDPRLDPMLAERGMLAFDVYGLYLQEAPEGPVYVIGFAATDEMLLGTLDLTVDVPPLADDGYQAESLILMSLE